MENKEKLWCECSKEEKRDMRNWEQRYRYATNQYKEHMSLAIKNIEGAIHIAEGIREKFIETTNKLAKELDEIEEKYNENDC